MQVDEFALFPTRLLAAQVPDADGLNDDLDRMFATRPEFQGDFDMHPGSLNLLRLADECPCVARVRDLFLNGLRRWLRGEGATGGLTVDFTLFCNLAAKGDFTLVHNHSADVVGVYYIRTAPTDRPAVVVPQTGDEYDYFAAEDGALVLHDPRFNANLTAVGAADYAKVFPRPGLMLLFPGSLWHSVTPHLGDARRLALSANFTLRWGAGSNAVPVPLDLDEPT